MSDQENHLRPPGLMTPSPSLRPPAGRQGAVQIPFPGEGKRPGFTGREKPARKQTPSLACGAWETPSRGQGRHKSPLNIDSRTHVNCDCVCGEHCFSDLKNGAAEKGCPTTAHGGRPCKRLR